MDLLKQQSPKSARSECVICAKNKEKNLSYFSECFIYCFGAYFCDPTHESGCQEGAGEGRPGIGGLDDLVKAKVNAPRQKLLSWSIIVPSLRIKNHLSVILMGTKSTTPPGGMNMVHIHEVKQKKKRLLVF